MMLKSFLLLFLTWFYLSSINAAKVDTVSFSSSAMKCELKTVVILPEGYDQHHQYPVVYLLHGYSGNYTDWISKVPAIKKYADQYNFIIVCPDGGFSGWYIDSPEKKNSNYETYITSELVNWIDAHFSTCKIRTGRAIAGLSMGGHGALLLAFRHQDQFGAAGSMSGAVDITGLATSFGLPDLLGDYSKYPERWLHNSVLHNVNLLKNDSLKIVIDCGSDDFLYHQNMALHKKLLYNKIDHDFIVSPGGHTWDHWAKAIQYEFLFLDNFFRIKGKG